MTGITLRVLLIEDNPGDARLIKEMLAEAGDLRFELTTASSLGGGLDHLYRDDFGLVLLDLSLPDSQGLATFRTLHEEIISVPIVVLTGTDDTSLALQALQEGAQDYLVKSTVTAARLIHSLRYALSRAHRQMVVEREHRASEDELRIAQRIWQRLLPADPVVPGFEIHGGCFPALLTGGDFFDYLPLPDNQVGLVLGDVTGHGVGPALLMAGTRAYLRAFTCTAIDIGDILARSNQQLVKDVDDRNVTLILARLDPHTRTLQHTNAGHRAGYLLGVDGAIREQLLSTDLALGIRPDSTFPCAPAVELHPGELVLFYTDGIPEAMDAKRKQFGSERMLAFVQENQHKSAREIVDGLHEEVRRWEQGQAQGDDITAMVIKVHA